MKSSFTCLRLPLVFLALTLPILLSQNIASATKDTAEETKERGLNRQLSSAVYLTANDLSIATGKPSLVLMSKGSTHIPVWSLSGGTEGQSVAGIVNGLPGECRAVKVEIVVTSTDAGTRSGPEDLYRVHLSQMVEDGPFTTGYSLGKPVRTPLPAGPFHSRKIVLESYYEVVPDAPLTVRIQREPGLPGDTFTRPTGLAAVKVTPLNAPAEAHVVQDVSGYNSWPMTQAIGEKLVCTYSRGSGHSIGEDARAVYARTSVDGGKSWTAETVVANNPGFGEVTVGKGLDSTGAMLLWVRRVGKQRHHDLYRTTDGVSFTLIATPELATQPMQITDVFAVPDVGLMALWFAGNYSDKAVHSWGVITSRDDGVNWTQTPVESGLLKADWPTEPAAVSLGDGRILAVARTESGPAQFQMVSTDNGATWKRHQTNISDIYASTPSLILDAETGLLSNYYYERGRGILRRRVVAPNIVFDNPLHWPASEAVATGSQLAWDSGNANATFIGDTHYVSFYSGEAPDTAVMLSELPEPTVAP
ncbi:sialidase family protein [Rhodopirellula bahusiensis]|uniref:sialidase family protein n=4 Tax=Rhodopirellula bahusiensis TaxID=2014065 RepID=UPI0032660A12